MLNTSTGNSKKLSNLVKIYTNNAKYSGHNNSFIFKLTIFYNICLRTNILLKAKIKTFFIMLKGPALDNYLSNIGISSIIMNFNYIRYSIRKKWIKKAET